MFCHLLWVFVITFRLLKVHFESRFKSIKIIASQNQLLNSFRSYFLPKIRNRSAKQDDTDSKVSEFKILSEEVCHHTRIVFYRIVDKMVDFFYYCISICVCVCVNIYIHASMSMSYLLMMCCDIFSCPCSISKLLPLPNI